MCDETLGLNVYQILGLNAMGLILWINLSAECNGVEFVDKS
jgi:hypothetical protein